MKRLACNDILPLPNDLGRGFVIVAMLMQGAQGAFPGVFELTAQSSPPDSSLLLSVLYTESSGS